MTSPTIDTAAALTLLDDQETAAYSALNAARTSHDAVVKHVFALKLAAITSRVAGFISVVISSEGENDDCPARSRPARSAGYTSSMTSAAASRTPANGSST